MLSEYLRSRLIYYFIVLFLTITLLFLQVIFSLDQVIIITVIISILITMSLIFIIEYYLLENNFRQIRSSLKEIEHAQLITYYCKRPKHFTSAYLYDMLDEIAYNLYQKHKNHVDQQLEYQEYLLLFIHDMKLPIQNLKLSASQEEIGEIIVLENLIDNLLNYSKISLNTVELKVKKFDLKNILDQIIKNNFDAILDSRLTITTTYQSHELVSDSYWLSFILKQVINNAIKYADTKLDIRVEIKEGQLIIMICNDGLLVQDDEIDLIFEKGSTGSNAKEYSTGYGLYYAKQIALKLNCDIKFRVNNNYNQVQITFIDIN